MALQNGHTPLYIAVWKGHLEVAQLLLDAGANKEAKDKVRGGRGDGRRCGCEGWSVHERVVCCSLGVTADDGFW